MKIEMKTFQQRLDDKDWVINEKLFTAMVEQGLDPNWTVNSDEFTNWVKERNRTDLLKIMSDNIDNQKLSWKWIE